MNKLIVIFGIFISLLGVNLSHAQNYHKVTDQELFNSQGVLDKGQVNGSINTPKAPITPKKYSMVTPEDFCLADIRRLDTRPGFYAQPLQNCNKGEEFDLSKEERAALEKNNEKPIEFSKEEQNLFSFFKKKRKKQLEQMQNKKIKARRQQAKKSNKEQNSSFVYRGND